MDSSSSSSYETTTHTQMASSSWSYKSLNTGHSELRISQLEEKLEELVKQNTALPPQSLAPAAPTTGLAYCIPEFSPEDRTMSANQWIEKIDQIRKDNKWNDLTTIYNMQLHLTGTAKSWYQRLPNYNFTWNQVRSLILHKFPEITDFAANLRKMLNRVKNPQESMTTYYNDKMELLRACGIRGKNSVSCIVDGILDPVIQNSARAGNYNSPEEFYEQYMFAYNFGEENIKRELNEESALDQISERDLRYVPRKRHYSQPYFDYNRKCFNCQGRGHLFANCKKPKVFCTLCDRVGHTAENCKAAFFRGSGSMKFYKNTEDRH
ncbi:uncharacterized protein LOC143200331 [Rhynchophorus ferrugineus]|uniref:uncharacterized protein LOC143200331 n=1 Tax=Rhynchophorus ferrugineus TaxID=354439 RepID=UPI003FCE2C61